MTQLMGRPIVQAPGELGTRPVLADVLTGVRTALLGLAAVAVPVLGLWVVTPYADGGAAGVVRLAGALWLLGHGAPVLRGGADAPLTVTPLLLGLLVVGQLYRAGARAAARRGPRPRWSGPSAVWCGYCAVAAAVVAHCSGAGPFRARVLPDVLVVTLLAAAATAAGARRARRAEGAGRPPGAGGPVLRWRALDRVPDWARPAGGAAVIRTAALAAGAGLVAAGAVVLAVAAVLAAVAGTGRSAGVLAHGPAAVAGLLLLSVLLLPNAVLWGTAYALGPGFAVGAGTVVAPGGAVLGPVPEFPLFALVAEPGAGGWRLAACLLPALAGVVPALLLGRAAADGAKRTDARAEADRPAGAATTWHPAATAVAVLAAALLTGVAGEVLGRLSGGALAGGRMAQLGPVPWRTGLAAAGWFAAVAVPGALLVRAWALGKAAGRTPGRGTCRGVTAEGGTALAAGVGTGTGTALAGHARRSAVLLRARAYALVLWLGPPVDGAGGTDGADGTASASPDEG
ncbi:DUF6350 family protein [Streptomyces sp. CB01881]|uniref:cell division protein PerM n=1 Tax=Streptomyces sp. CB01881 TaxID=2078691 RepID=UPI000CDC690A|nr:DUF6350 family protein [Streptomyces sp. CB01881]AUY51386.1 hypothetical protein C2142_23400 [Streptomyces sp. CB01881]TYC74774.1 hypothetical protein EH183_23380 [Streptomyces sp. CB01881]